MLHTKEELLTWWVLLIEAIEAVGTKNESKEGQNANVPLPGAIAPAQRT